MLFAATPVVAGDFEDGIAAYWAGDHQKAFRLIEPLAGQGHAPAQAHLGLTYLHGTGAPQDNAKAVCWFTKAVKQGIATA